MTIQLNGAEHILERECSVSELLTSLGLSGKPVVVEWNGSALFPREFPETTVRDGDIVEIISIVAGG